jgi:hypothetical protein
MNSPKEIFIKCRDEIVDEYVNSSNGAYPDDASYYDMDISLQKLIDNLAWKLAEERMARIIDK